MRRLAVLAAASACVFALGGATASAATFDVTTTDDEVDAGACATTGAADCALREAIIAANDAAGADTVRIPPGTYPIQIPKAPGDESATTPADGDFDITDDLTIERLGTGVVVIDGMDIDCIFEIHTSTTDVSIADVTITNGNRLENTGNVLENGGGIRTAGQLTLDRVLVSDNVAKGSGGGVAVIGAGLQTGGAGNLLARDSTFSGNSAQSGGGLHVAATGSPAPRITLERSVVRGNQANAGPGSGQGGGLASFFGEIVINHSEISDNTANGQDGATSGLGSLTLRSSTVSGNRSLSTSFSGSGGVRVAGGNTVLIEDSTIARNIRGADGSNTQKASNLIVDDLSGSNPSLTIRRSIIAEGGSDPAGPAPNCRLTQGSNPINVISDHSLDDDNTCLLDDPTDKPGATAGLAALAANGGPTRTHALLPGSAAIDAGGAGCPVTDQRGPGFPRPRGAACDIGAFEAEAASDGDTDGVPDATDNCPAAANPDQLNTDGDAAGNACDTDDDGDGAADTADNCQVIANAGQQDSDADGVGDACDGDVDGDGVPDASDNCPGSANPSQGNGDGDAAGDACDTDDDGDGALDGADNCPTAANLDQADTDRDGTGDACDPDADGDNVPNGTDNCPTASNGGQQDTDTDGAGDACDADDDNDGDLDAADNCRVLPNPDQADADGTGIGDACEASVLGQVTLDAQPHPDALVTLCVQGDRCRHDVTGADGRYQIAVPRSGKATLAVSTDELNVAPSEDVSLDVTNASRATRDIQLRRLRGMPKGTSIIPLGHIGGPVPSVIFFLPFDLEHRACENGEVSYRILSPAGQVIQSGKMQQTVEDKQLFRASVPALSTGDNVFGGLGAVEITVKGCDGGGSISFDLYIDPSGWVRDLKGRPIPGATVRLYRSDAPTGPFAIVPNGSRIMSPNNRINPDRTDAGGHFGWDVIPGYYMVQAEKKGCKVPGTTRPFAQTRVMEIPPPVFDLDIRLDCPYRPKLALGPLPRGNFLVNRRGRTSYRLTNLSPFRVTGTVTLKRRRATVGIGAFKIRANRGKSVKVTLTRTARVLLAKKRRLKVTAVVSARGVAGTKLTARRAIRLRRAR